MLYNLLSVDEAQLFVFEALLEKKTVQYYVIASTLVRYVLNYSTSIDRGIRNT